MKDNPQVGDRFFMLTDKGVTESKVYNGEQFDNYPFIEEDSGVKLFCVSPDFDRECSYEVFWSDKVTGWITYSGSAKALEEEVWELLN